MKTVLWISRHTLTDDQQAGLERFCGGSFRLIHRVENLDTVAQLGSDLARADVIAAVLPLPLLAQLVNAVPGKPVLIEQARRTLIPVPGGEPAVCFCHGGWLRINRLVLELDAV